MSGVCVGVPFCGFALMTAVATSSYSPLVNTIN